MPLLYRGEDPYITDDERKLNEIELRMVKQMLAGAKCKYFNVCVGRLYPPDTWDSVAMVDRAFLRLLGPLGDLVAGRFVLACNISKRK